MRHVHVQQFVDEGLGNTAHLVYAGGARDAALIDPLRDVDVYLAAADALGVRITHVFETHVHNDFISGARELATRVDAQVCSSADGRLAYPHRPLRDGDRVRAGGVELTVLATPGHTPEHLAYLARDVSTPAGSNAPAALFSGGSLLVGAVSRTDLLGREQAAAYAHELFRSLRDRILPLPDETRVYPTHGAGSFCTATPGAARRTTLGQERKTNPLLQFETPAAFATALLGSMPSYPTYFGAMRAINREGPPVLGSLPALPPLGAEAVRAQFASGVALVDARPVAQYAAAHIPGAYSVELRAAFASWVGWVVPFGTPLVVVAESPQSPGVHEEIVRQLVRIGYDRLLGYLDGGVAAWEAKGFPVWRLPAVSVLEAHQALSHGAAAVGPAGLTGLTGSTGSTGSTGPTGVPVADTVTAPAPGDLLVLDVRQDAEWDEGHAPGARHIEAGALAQQAATLPAGATIAVHCGHQARAATALSVLERAGLNDLRLISGGWEAWEEAGLPIARPGHQAGGGVGIGAVGGRP